MTKRFVFSKSTTEETNAVPIPQAKKYISLLPKTQGAQETWVEEVVKTSHGQWQKLFDDKKTKPILQVSTQVSPLLPLISIFSPSLAAKIYGATRKVEMALGKMQLFKPFGLNVVLIQEKI